MGKVGEVGMTIEEWAKDFKSYVNTLDMQRDDYKSIMEYIDDAVAMLKEQPEIVRCEDCKWWDKKDESNYGYCHACKHGYHSDHWEIGIYRTYRGDWFCADGEKRE